MSEHPRRPAPRAPQVRLVVRVLLAQAFVVAWVVLPFNRRHPATVLATLAFVAVICAFAAIAASGTPGGRTAVLAFELAVLLYGGYQVVIVDAYLAGTIMGFLAFVVLLHPAVARAYGVRGRSSPPRLAPSSGGIGPPERGGLAGPPGAEGAPRW